MYIYKRYTTQDLQFQIVERKWTNIHVLNPSLSIFLDFDNVIDILSFFFK